ncbi:hypothetical protein V9T40_000480 [Parthenolecanium corni]|uniref:Uncharacterized protein n=1 Tax=Parthenolecanium corni TaxID=536013 RepID=A0AAN9Y0E9_9HEMI
MVGEKVRLWHTSSVCGNTTSDHRKICTTTVAELSPTVGSATIGHYFLTMSESDFRLWHNLVRQSDLPQSEIIFVHVGVRLWHNLVRQSDLPQSDIIFVLCRSPISDCGIIQSDSRICHNRTLFLYQVGVRLWHNLVRLSDLPQSDIIFVPIRLWHNLVRQSDLPQSEIIFVHVGVRLWHNLVRQSDLPQSDIIFVLCRSPISDCGIIQSDSRICHNRTLFFNYVGVRLWHNLVRQSDLPQSDIIFVLFRLWHNLVRQSDLPQSDIFFNYVGVRLWHNLVRQSDVPQSEIIF